MKIVDGNINYVGRFLFSICLILLSIFFIFCIFLTYLKYNVEFIMP